MVWVWLGPLWLTVGWWFVHTFFASMDAEGIHLKIPQWHRPTYIGFLRWVAGRQLKSPAQIRALEIEDNITEG